MLIMKRRFDELEFVTRTEIVQKRHKFREQNGVVDRQNKNLLSPVSPNGCLIPGYRV